MGCLSKGGTMVRFIKFAGVGLVAGTVDISLVWALTKFIFGGYYGQMVVYDAVSFCFIYLSYLNIFLSQQFDFCHQDKHHRHCRQ